MKDENMHRFDGRGNEVGSCSGSGNGSGSGGCSGSGSGSGI